MNFTVFRVDPGYAGMLWCGHRHQKRGRAMTCLRQFSDQAPSVLLEAGVGMSEAMYQRKPLTVERWGEIHADRTEEGRCNWKKGTSYEETAG